jgi:hypothetical protein
MRFVVSLALAGLVGTAHAQDTSTRAVFERFNLLGTFARDCTQPVSSTNQYIVFRPLDAERIQSDLMIGPSERARAGVIDRATALGPDEVALSGFSQEFGRSNFVYRVERNRHRALQWTRENEKVVVDGRAVNGGAETPWWNKCG